MPQTPEYTALKTVSVCLSNTRPAFNLGAAGASAFADSACPAFGKLYLWRCRETRFRAVRVATRGVKVATQTGFATPRISNLLEFDGASVYGPRQFSEKSKL
jgi:hypothetical protein